MNMQNLSLFEIMLVVLIFGLYFLPFLIAALRQHKNVLAIFLLNLALGWTFLGWIAALIWSVMK
ncbi:MAG: superinfection immunity protein [Candidatus Omnitrophota bacterium]